MDEDGQDAKMAFEDGHKLSFGREQYPNPRPNFSQRQKYIKWYLLTHSTTLPQARNHGENLLEKTMLGLHKRERTHLYIKTVAYLQLQCILFKMKVILTEKSSYNIPI